MYVAQLWSVISFWITRSRHPARRNGHSFLLSLTLTQFTNTPMADQTMIGLIFCPSSPTDLSMLRNESTDEYTDDLPVSLLLRCYPFVLVHHIQMISFPSHREDTM